MIGQTVSHYRITRELGTGGMGVVYEAVDTKLDRTVALKFLPPESTRDAEAKTRFIHEAKAASALDHPNVCNIHEIDETEGGQLFLAMACYEGETLKERITRGPLPVDEALDIARQVAEGLTKAHERDIIHRDIKPANIFITKDGVVKILDFGLAKLEGQTQLTRTGTTLGTVAYMSPEQARGGLTDNRSDLWSLGALLYEMVTGRVPFQGDHPQAVIYAIQNTDPPRLLESGPDDFPGLRQMVEHALQKDPNKRYQTADEILGDLDRIFRGSAPRARQKRLMPSGRVCGVAALVLVLVVLVAIPASRRAIWSRFDSQGRTDALHLAVLPFENIGGDLANQVFCDGMLETLTSKLTELEKFHGSMWVVPASEVRQLEVTSATEAAGAFGINLAITGSVQPLGNSLRLAVNLVSVESETPRQLDSSVKDIRLMDIALLQDQMVHELAGMLDVELAPDARTEIAADKTEFSAAYEAYVRALGYLQQRPRESDDVDRAIEGFNHAIELDPDYGLAYSGLGSAYWSRYLLTKDSEWVDLARENYDRAVAMNPELVLAHVGLGKVNRGTGHYEEAVRNYQAALALDPGNAAAYLGLANAYQDLGRFDEAEATFLTAIDMKPNFYASHSHLGYFYMSCGRYEDALFQYGLTVKLAPENVDAYTNQGAAYWYLDRLEEASEMFTRANAIEPSSAAYNNLGTIAYIRGRYTEAARMYRKALTLENTDFGIWGALGNAYFWSPGERDKAPAAFRRARELAAKQLEVNPRDGLALAYLAAYEVSLGEHQAAREHLARALAIDTQDIFIIYLAAHTYEQLGERDQALKWLENALAAGYPSAEITADPFMEELSQDKRFTALLQRYGQ